jgi:hypothetical protein
MVSSHSAPSSPAQAGVCWINVLLTSQSRRFVRVLHQPHLSFPRVELTEWKMNIQGNSKTQLGFKESKRHQNSHWSSIIGIQGGKHKPSRWVLGFCQIPLSSPWTKGP